MRRILYAALAIQTLMLISCDKTYEGSDPMSDIVLKTGDASEIAETSAKLSGTVTLPTIETSSAKFGMQISETEDMSSSRKIEFEGIRLTDAFSVTASGLTQGTKYYYRTYVTLNGRDRYAEIKNFNTVSLSVKLTLNPLECITHNSAVVSGSAEIPVSYKLTALAKLYYSASGEPESGGKMDLTLDYDGNFCQTLPGLAASTKYNCKVVVTAGEEKFESSVQSFTTTAEVTVGSVMPPWNRGFFDIHAISVGNGESFMYIMPDGTSMLIDAGEVATVSNSVSRRPNSSIRGPKVIASYINHFLPATGSDKLDYMYLSHFHNDHFGAAEMSGGTEHGYMHMGMAAVYDDVKCKKIIDRGWPDYGDKPAEIGYYLEYKDGGSTDNSTGEFAKFVKYANSADGVAAERFETGRKDQFVMTHGGGYDFEIINIIGNGKALVADGSTGTYAINGENAASTGCYYRYGKFDYAACGDLTSSGQNYFARYITTMVPYPYMEGFKAHHHLSSNSWGSGMQSGNFHPHFTFCQCFLATDDSHIPPSMIDLATAEGGNLFLCAASEKSVSEYSASYAKMKDYDGHFICRVSKDGTYYIYKLSDLDLNYTVKAIYGPYQSK